MGPNFTMTWILYKWLNKMSKYIMPCLRIVFSLDLFLKSSWKENLVSISKQSSAWKLIFLRVDNFFFFLREGWHFGFHKMVLDRHAGIQEMMDLNWIKMDILKQTHTNKQHPHTPTSSSTTTHLVHRAFANISNWIPKKINYINLRASGH